jgi:hypothetical protein
LLSENANSFGPRVPDPQITRASPSSGFELSKIKYGSQLTGSLEWLFTKVCPRA